MPLPEFKKANHKGYPLQIPILNQKIKHHRGYPLQIPIFNQKTKHRKGYSWRSDVFSLKKAPLAKDFLCEPCICQTKTCLRKEYPTYFATFVLQNCCILASCLTFLNILFEYLPQTSNSFYVFVVFWNALCADFRRIIYVFHPQILEHPTFLCFISSFCDASGRGQRLQQALGTSGKL